MSAMDKETSNQTFGYQNHDTLIQKENEYAGFNHNVGFPHTAFTYVQYESGAGFYVILSYPIRSNIESLQYEMGQDYQCIIPKANEPELAKKPSFACDICTKSYMTKHSLVRHKNIHLKKYPCNFCPKFWPSKTDLNRHLKTHENRNERKLLENGDGDIQPDPPKPKLFSLFN